MSLEKLDKLQGWLAGDNASKGLLPKSSISDLLSVVDDPIMGRCMKTTQSLHRHETIIEIPSTYLLNYVTALKHLSCWNSEIKEFLVEHISNFSTDSIVEDKVDSNPIYESFKISNILDLTSFQLLSLYIILEKRRLNHSFWKHFIKILPTPSDFSNIPLTWLESASDIKHSLFKLLPTTAIEHTNKQHKQFSNDYITVLSVLPEDSVVSRREFLWAWLSINTRCLYYNLPKYLPITKSSNAKESNFTLVPYVDLINHTYLISEDNFCNALTSNRGSFMVTTNGSVYDKDEQLWFSYGAHSDEFLQCEYGFSFNPGINKNNYINVTDMIVRLISNKSDNIVSFLKENCYWSEYTLSDETEVSFRTRIALATLVEDEAQFRWNENSGIWECPLALRNFIDGYNDGEKYYKTEKALTKKMLNKLKVVCEGKLGKLKDFSESPEVEVVRRLNENLLVLLIQK